MTRLHLLSRTVAVAALLLLSLGFSACSFESHEAYVARRREKLLTMYPPGKTTREEVKQRFGHEPRETYHRPAQGWQAHADRRAARYAAGAEARIGKTIPLADHYSGADGMFGLCYCWFYFDRHGRLLDTEWEWSSD